jgi:hypothetical protein
MRIKEDGNVGIGTTAPEQKLTVETAASRYGLLHTDGTRKLATYVDSNGTWLGSISNHSVRFFTNATEKMIINFDGNVGIGGAASDFYKLQVSGNQRVDNGTVSIDLCPSASFLLIGGSALATITISDEGDIENQNNSYGGFSDIRMKENITPANSQIEDFKKYNFVNYNLIGRDTKGKKHLGLLAQEVLDISPGIVNYDEEKDQYSIMYSILYLKACKCIQELIVENEELKSRLDKIEKHLFSL